jgi:N-acetyl-gamma-glutamyl-phosphate reductase
MRVTILGASGYAGAELLRLISTRPDLTVVAVSGDSSAGLLVGAHVPSLAAAYPTLRYHNTDEAVAHDTDVVFLALPHGVSQRYVPDLLERQVMVVDLGADFRLNSASDYEQWYGHAHARPDLLALATYGLVERHREELRGARFIAVPGCYPTATVLAMAPFSENGIVSPQPLVVNALSGVSGAGRASSDRLHFPRVSGGAEAYGLLSHRHTVEMQMELHGEVLFTPHLIPIARGMLVTAYGFLQRDFSTDEALALLHATYAHDPFVVVTDQPPSAKDALGSNVAFVSAAVDQRTRTLVAMSSIDNLTKGAAGQALQAFNVALGLEETLGVPLAAVAP